MEVFFPVTELECFVVLAQEFDGAELYGLASVEWDAPGVLDDAVWIATHVDDAIAERHEDIDGDLLGYRAFTFPCEQINACSWRVVGEEELEAARRAEREAAEASRKRQREL